jgi:hypothetical protein
MPDSSRQGFRSRAAAGQVGRSEPRLQWSSCDPFMVCHIPSRGEQSKTKQRVAFRLGECSYACLGACGACVVVFGGVNDRGYGSHGKESTKSDIVHRKSEALAWLVYRRFPGINLNAAQPAASASRE